MTKVIQHLWFEKDMAAAIARYIELIPGSRLEWSDGLQAETPSGPAGRVKMAAFTLAGQHYRGLEAGPLDPFNRAFSIMVECADQAEIDRLWEGLTEGGVPGACGWLTDRWGMSWQIIPQVLGELMRKPGAAGPVTEAMLKMGKFHIAGLQAAAGL